MPSEVTYWLSYGAGLNSTALAVLLCEGRLPQYLPFRVVFADTKDEQEETYRYVETVMLPYFRKHGHTLEICCDREGVLERAERLGITLSRTLRTCTHHGKINPIQRHIKGHERGEPRQLIGIDAGEQHRARPAEAGDWLRHYPLVELDIDREGCADIIRAAGLPVPPKSGCWHCPFLRVGAIMRLATQEPCKFARIERLEQAATEKHGETARTQWGDKPASAWKERANGGPLFALHEVDPPCACMDG